ncbi:MAG TPA: hypothetical protein VHO47_05585 [Candidatus Babeliales bacterium]|nr:hypothetical protein [Candidatus Babeliales bacterium]
MKKFFNKIFNSDEKRAEHNSSFKNHLKDRLGNMHRKMSRGASNIARMIRTRGKWGNKEQFGRGGNNKHHKAD